MLLQKIYVTDSHHAVTVQTEDGPELRPKSLLYENLKDNYLAFKEENPEVEIGISRFGDLRPQEVVYDDGKANLKICLCKYICFLMFIGICICLE